MPVFGHELACSTGCPFSSLLDPGDRFHIGRLAFLVGLQVVDGDQSAVDADQSHLAAVALLAAHVHTGHAVDHIHVTTGSGA